MQQCTLYATFVGINAYPEGQLSGCIADVLDLDLLLREQIAQQKEVVYKPQYFLAPNEADKTRLAEYPTQLDYKSPTFANITKEAFRHFKDAKKGDICLFYYSGHGSQIDAPSVFHFSKPDQQNETIVCVDSRDPAEPEARDIIDKELAYLIWQAFDKKESHNLVIMDCCHSGNNTRSLMKTAPEVKFRFIPSSRNKIPFESYIGYGDGAFYTVEDGNAKIKTPRYVHLASCRDDEKAQETMGGGLFTVKLLEALRAGGTAKSYRNLMQSLAITVGNRADKQTPVAFSQEDKDLDQQFLSSSIIPYKPTFEVRGGRSWKMFGGAIHSLTAGTKVRVTDGELTADVALLEVFPTHSILDPTGMRAFDTDTETAKAIVLKVPEPFMKVSVKVKDPKPLKDAYRHPYFTLLFEENAPGAQYIIQTLEDGQYALFAVNGTTPLFKREHDPAEFLENVNKVGNWLNAVELKNIDPAFTKDDFIFEWQVIEGVEDVDAVKEELKPQAEGVTLHYRNGFSPAFRLKISISPKAAFTSCYIKALYLDSTYGINGDLIRDDNNQLEGGNGIFLSYAIGTETFVTLPVILEKKYSLYNINEAIDLLKIVVSDTRMNLDQYNQETLELDDPNGGTRAIDVTRTRAGKTVEQPRWSIFTFDIKCVGEQKEQILKPGAKVDFAGFTVETPDGISAKAFALTAADQQQAFEEVKTRSADVAPGFKPSANIWGEALTDTPFAHIQALELFPEGGKLEIQEGKPLIIRPNAPRTATRSLGDDKLEEIIIPYGYDSNLQMYIPLGYADDKGNIFIEQLPPETPGQLRPDAVNTRSLGSSVKLFFKKIFRPKEVNKLVLYALENKAWVEQKNMDKLSSGGKAVLLIHGIIGDTKYMVEVFKEHAAGIDFILTYDYENLSTAVSQTAEILHNKLKAAGFGGAGKMPELSIVAHSMGGLVSRWLIEQVPGVNYVKRLILVGSPCGGSEMAKLGVSAFGLLTQALNVTGPVKYAITGLSYLLKHLKLHPGTTLQELSPGSDLLQKLSLSGMADKVQYHIIGGNTDLLKDYNGDDFFLKRIAASLKDKILYPGLSFALYEKEPNDMAVTLKSMQAIHQLDATAQVQIVASNHLTYFREGESLTKLLKLI
ncbi:caspase family protein [Chitinophaga niabensis]|uniref:Caspase domain-containing protein n=1 Tax=Chitinophaga niabensis TaxID=536979 RepID=A0A1N6D4M7_9BACT|nr:caspase family protein [Chitinophaga niabensis]SIN65699.1 Caspase domain-containing protein [Chitinophaga niabensis]